PRMVGDGAVSYMMSIAVRSRHRESAETIFTTPDSNITRKSSQRIMNNAMGRGGEWAPRPGRRPAGAKGMHSSPVSSIRLSTCAGVNSPHATTKETNTSQQTASATRGQRFKTSATAARNPSQASVEIMAALEFSQKSVGALKKASIGGVVA